MEIEKDYEPEKERIASDWKKFQIKACLAGILILFFMVSMTMVLIHAPDHEHRIAAVEYFAAGLSLVIAGWSIGASRRKS